MDTRSTRQDPYVPPQYLALGENGDYVIPPEAPSGWWLYRMSDGLVEDFTPWAEILAARAAKKPRTFTQVVA